MSAVIHNEQERSEIERVLESGIFEKSPRLGRFFRFVCQRHMEGRGDCLKEYSIAVEALGRGDDFDPKKDSIVRVEAHRLRKRLEEYYRGPGAGHELQIIIPNGQYRPHFVCRSAPVTPPVTPPATPAAPELSVTVLPPPMPVSIPEPVVSVMPPSPERPRPWRWTAIATAFLLAAAGLGLWGLPRLRAHPKTVPEKAPADEVWQGAPVDTAGAEIRLLAGYHGAPYVDRQSHIWQPDAFYRGGYSRPFPRDRYIEAQPDPHLLHAARVGDFEYLIPVRQGTYELHLLFAETEFGRGNKEGTGEGSRTFTVLVNGETRIANCDPLAAAGAPNRLYERVLPDISPQPDGHLHLQFKGSNGPAMLSGLEIVPSAPGRMHPVRMVTQANPVTDVDGRVWAADEYVIGGTTVFRENVLFNPREKALFQGERYGNFSYRIPLAPGKYRLTLHFAEQWFNTPWSPTDSVDSRVFDVYANGVALLRDFVVGREAGGCNRSVGRSFDNLHPNAQGTMVLEFLPVKNYAELNAIEVVQTQ